MAPHDETSEGHEELTVDASFEDDLRLVEASVSEYLARQGASERAGLQASIERLDDQIAASEAFDSNSSLFHAFGSAPRLAIVGESSENPVVEEVIAADFQAQTTLVRAAKDELREPSPRALEALRAAAAALSEGRGHATS
jgi:hypothetical protein